MHSILQFLSGFTRSDWIAVVGIAVSTFIAIMLYKFGRKVSFQQRLIRQHEIQSQLDPHIGHDIEIYNVRLYHKPYFYKNKKDVFRGYCYLGSGLNGYDIDGVELLYSRESWGDNFNVEMVGIVPYEWIDYIKVGGDGATSKTILFIKAPWFSFPYRRTVYYRYGRTKTNAIYDKYHRLSKPLKLQIIHKAQRAYRRLRYHFYLRWKMRRKK